MFVYAVLPQYNYILVVLMSFEFQHHGQVSVATTEQGWESKCIICLCRQNISLDSNLHWETRRNYDF